jgi:hypothetical protein
VLVVLLLLGAIINGYSHAAQAMENYHLDGRFWAPFPGTPALAGEIEQQGGRTKSYEFIDEEAMIVFNATYTVLPGRFAPDQVQSALHYYVQGQARVQKGVAKVTKSIELAGSPGVEFVLTYSIQGIEFKKYAIVVYAGACFYSWAVQDIPGHSTISAYDLFRAHVARFRVD